MPRRNSHFRTPGHNSCRTSVLPNLGITLGTIPLAPAQPLSLSPMTEDVSGPNAEAGQLPTTSLCPEALQPLIKETLRQLGIQGTEKSGSRSSGLHRSVRMQKIILVKEQQKLMNKDTDKDWKVSEYIFSHTFLISFIDYDPQLLATNI